jgi:uncharacterized protein (TIGR03437 family)
MKRTRGMALVVALAALAASPAAAYYHYVHYASRNAPFAPIADKFDLNLLPNKTVTFLVSDIGPAVLAPNDSFPSILSQVRQATLAWNSVDGSDLRVVFGGMIQGNTTPNNPGVQVVFGELPPGTLAFTVHTRAGNPTIGPNGPFYPILRSITTFKRDFTQDPGPSYLDSFFTTAVHEFGHALGLQHTFTSSAMTVTTNRNTNRSRPLDADDIAGLSLLYPKAGYLASVGSISGRVTSNGQGVSLASVVAIRPASPAISTLTNPDGTYRIDGLPPDSYFVYVHPLPPDGDITLPVDANNQTFPASAPFETLFFPGTRELTQFTPIGVPRGGAIANINFNVQPRPSVPVFQAQTFSFIGQTGIRPAFVPSAAGSATFVFNCNPATPIPQSAIVLGVGPATVQPYGAPLNLALTLQFPIGAGGIGTRHLVMNLGTDMYVMPAALNVVTKQPPSITAMIPLGDGAVQVTGANLSQDTRVFFDGLPASIVVPFAGNDAAGTVVVTPPAGAPGQRSNVSVFNSDGQSSLLLQAANPPSYVYTTPETPQVVVSPATLPAGSSSLVEITGLNTRFIDGQVTVGFGTQDVFVRRLWVLSPTRAVANVTVQPNAVLGASEISVISGFQIISQPFGFVTQPANPRLPNISLPMVNSNPTQTNFFPGATVSLFGSSLAVTPTSATMTLTDANNVTLPVAIQGASAGQINFVIPANAATGLATLRLNNGADAAFPVAIQIDAQPPVILNVTNSSNVTLDTTRPASTGDLLTLLVSGLDPGSAVNFGRLRVAASGIELPVTQVVPVPGQPGLMQVQIVVTISFGGQSVPLTISEDGSVSAAYSIAIR